MKKFSFLGKVLLVGLFVMTFNQSCTDLEEELFSEVTPENFFQTDEEFISSLGAAYASLYGYMGCCNYYAMQEVTSDAMVVPTRGQDWFDGGVWQRLHLHTYNSEDDRVKEGWNFLFGGINTCNRLIFQFEEAGNPVGTAFISEIKALRAMMYYFLLDLYGNIPIVDQFDVPDGFAPPTESRADVYAFVETEMTSALPDLSKDVNQSTYGRMNYYAAQAVLTKLYLNAEVYTGTAQWQKAADAAFEIIDSRNFNLTGDYFENFNTSNEGSSEFIFAIPYDQVFAQGFNMPQMTLHYGSQATYDLQAQPWNGFCTVQEFYDSYEDHDLRKGVPNTNAGPSGVRGNFLVGPQFESDGVTQVEDSGAEDDDPDGPGLNFQSEINELGPNALRQAGARVGKYEFALGATPDLSNDFAVFRYADILLCRAEALWRMDNSDMEALMLVNSIRTRAGVDPFMTLTAENILAERGREMFAEAWRRSDQIRFGTYNDAWWEKPADPSDHVNIFPVPKEQLDANPNLSQNPGY